MNEHVCGKIKISKAQFWRYYSKMRKEVQLDPFFHLQSKLTCRFGLGAYATNVLAIVEFPHLRELENAISTIDNTLVADSSNLPQKRYLF